MRLGTGSPGAQILSQHLLRVKASQGVSTTPSGLSLPPPPSRPHPCTIPSPAQLGNGDAGAWIFFTFDLMGDCGLLSAWPLMGYGETSMACPPLGWGQARDVLACWPLATEGLTWLPREVQAWWPWHKTRLTRRKHPSIRSCSSLRPPPSPAPATTNLLPSSSGLFICMDPAQELLRPPSCM